MIGSSDHWAGVCTDVGLERAVSGIPEVHMALFVRGDKLGCAGVKADDRGGVLVFRQCADGGAGSGVENADALVGRCGRGRLSIGTDIHRSDCLRHARQGDGRLGQLPDARRTVLSDGCETEVVGVEGDIMDRSLMASQQPGGCPIGQIPEMGNTLLATPGDHRIVSADGQVIHASRAGGEFAHRRAGGSREDLDSGAVADD